MCCQKTVEACSSAHSGGAVAVSYAVSERRACRVLCVPRASCRYQSVRDERAALRTIDRTMDENTRFDPMGP